MVILPTVLLVGGTNTGKTNFLARLWLKLSQRNGLLKADKLPDDLNYLEGASRNLLQGEFAGHTPTGTYRLSEIPVYWDQSGQRVDGAVGVPDRSGEQWQNLYQDRIWPDDFEQLISARTGCLVFIRAQSPEHIPLMDVIRQAEIFGIQTDRHSQTPSIAQDLKKSVDVDKRDIPGVPGEKPPAGDDTRSEEGGDEDAANDIESTQTQIEEFDPPTEVVLVDLLQCIQHAFVEMLGSKHVPKIGIVVSAWDLVPSEFKDRTAKEFIDFNYPMLQQYVDHNRQSCEFAFFGTSVAGGDFDEDPNFKNSYLQSDPFSAGYVVHDLQGVRAVSNDFSIPLAWALGVTGGSV